MVGGNNSFILTAPYPLCCKEAIVQVDKFLSQKNKTKMLLSATSEKQNIAFPQV